MREEPTRSLLLLDANPEERRLISAIAARAGMERRRRRRRRDARSHCSRARTAAKCTPRLLGSWDADQGPQLIAALREHRANLPVIVLSHGDTVSVAVEAMRAGASDFLVRPVAPERLLEALAANADRRRAAGELAPVSEKLAPALALEQLIGAAPEFRAALAVAAKSARNRLPVLIVGEPGTGKETLARAIHGASLRAKGPLLTLDCKAVAANIIDSELFGHEKGAFPGAFAAKIGKLVQARRRHAGARRDRLPAARDAGAARPRARDRRGPARSGSTAAIRSTSGSSRPAAARCPKTSIAGLAERIGATTVTLPPLRERSGDIPALARHLLSGLRSRPALKPLSIGNDALAVLMRYGWPGNVRQLAGVLFRAALQCDGELAHRAALPPHRDPVALHCAPNRLRADVSQARSERSDRRRAGRDPVHAPMATCARSRISRPTSSASRSAIIAAA